MKLYLVTRTDEADWDEHDGFVVRAANEENALKLAHEFADKYNSPKRYTFRSDNTKIVEITNEGPEEVILDSFIAG